MSQEAKKIGLDLQPAAQGFARLSASATALNVPMSQQKALFDAFAKSSATLHLSTENSNRALLALEQMFAKGKIQAQELRLQLGQAIPGAAARFQQAVMEMTKGTDLQGKSFDQLLQSGDLYTDKFLPALVQALQESSRGWEDASESLNAQLNRLSSNWFKLKSEVSGGLFNDAATGSVRIMADNLSNLASAAGLAGGLVLSRYAGLGASKAYGKASDAIDAQRIAREEALAAGAVAKENLAAARAQIKNNEAALAGATVARKQAFETRIAAQSLHAKALAENNAAQATLAHQANTMTLSANIRAQRDAMAAATVAQSNLTRAQRQYDAAIAGGNALKQQQIVLEARLTEAKAASAAATEAQVLAERQLAATGAASMLARGAKGLGNFALGLVGGPWGAAIAAVGALGYAFYAMSESQKRAHEAFAAEIQDLKDLPSHVSGVTAAYKTLGSTVSATSLVGDWSAANDKVAKAQDQIKALKPSIIDLQALQNTPSLAGAGTGLRNDYSSQIARAKEQLAQLQAQAAPSKAAFLAMSATLRDQLGPAFDDVKAKAEKVNDQDFDKFIASLDAATRKAISNADQLRSAFAQGFNSLQSMADSFNKQAEDYAKTNA